MEKKRTIKSLLLVLMAAIMSLSASAYNFNFDFMVDGLCYNINSDGTSVTVTYQGTGEYGYGYANLSGTLNIPSTVAYDSVSYSVSSIGEYAFSNCTGLTSVDIPNSVADIGQSAFWGCTGLTSVNIPNSVAVIGQSAFSGCIGLTSVDIPNSVTTISRGLFYDCISLTSVNIPNSVTSIGISAFSSCRSLTSVDIPGSVTSIGSEAFNNCFGLTSLSISNLVTSIGDAAFTGCRGLKSIVVESGNPNYDSRDNCNALIETATNTLLAGCKNTVIPNSVTSIGKWAFCLCTGLTSVTIPNSVTSIEKGAFYGCTSLTSVNIPSSVTSIGEQAFEDCTKLTSVSISDLAAWCDIDFSGAKSNPLSFAHSLYLNGSLITELSIPSTVSTLKGYTFSGGNFTSLVVHNSVTEINNTAFYNCTNMTTVTIDNNSIVSKDNHNNSMDYPIKDMFGSQVQHYFIGDNVKSIGNYAFQKCTSLVSVTTGNSVESIGEYAFNGCSALTAVNFGNKVTNIKQQSFRDCSSLTSLDFPSSLEVIGSCAFLGCVGLTTVNIPSSVTSISTENPFYGCSGLESIVVESGNPNFDSRDNCNAIIRISNNELVAGCKNTVIPHSVSYIGSYAFCGCKGLTSVVIPHSVKQIFHGAFWDCEFTSVTLHNNLYTDEYYPVTENFVSDKWDTLTIVGNGVWDDQQVKNTGNIKYFNIGSGITSLSINCSPQLPVQVINSYAETPPVVDVNEWIVQYHLFSSFNSALHVPASSGEAYSADSFWGQFTNIIPDLTDKVTLDRTSASLAQGRTLKLNVTEMPAGGEVIWGTTNPSVATVENNGTVTATGDGGCYIFASLASNPAVYASCYININQAETFYAYNGYLKFQVIDDEKHEAALVGYKEAISANGSYWGIQFPADEPVVVPSVVTHNGVEYTVTEIDNNALYLLGSFSNPDRYDEFWPTIILPETIRRLGKHSLWTNPMYGYTRVNLPLSLKEMDDECLLTCTLGGQYTIPENVNRIGNNVFQGPGLEVLTFKNHDFELKGNMFDLNNIDVLCLWGENLSIASGTFNGTSSNETTTINRVVFGVNPFSIASNAFGENTEIGKIAVYSPVPYDLTDDAFSSTIYQNAKLLVPETALESYQNAPGWKNFAHIVVLSEGDVNLDGIVTASDVTALYNYLLNGDLENFMSSDVDGDGNVTSSDITSIYNLMLGE